MSCQTLAAADDEAVERFQTASYTALRCDRQMQKKLHWVQGSRVRIPPVPSGTVAQLVRALVIFLHPSLPRTTPLRRMPASIQLEVMSSPDS